MTHVLAIATATGRVGVAIRGRGQEASLSLAAGRRHGETLAPAIRALTDLAASPLSDIDVVAVDAGPGLFTGLRVGVATAKALAAALGRPVAVGSSLDLLAEPHAHFGRPVVSVVDARRSEVFWAAYEPGPTGLVRVSDPVAAAPEKLAVVLADRSELPIVVGDGARRYRDILGIEPAPEMYDHPSAAVLAVMASDLPTVAAEKVEALYLRGADVRIGWETR